MNKKYVMLVNSIAGMGGGQMYTNNKLLFMKKRGWDSCVFFGVEGKSIISTLSDCENNCIKELVSSPLVYSKKTVCKVVDLLIEKIGEAGRMVIESTSGHTALWGEILAQRLKCKHMVHLLDERNDAVIPIEYLDYYKFKLNRRELSGINPNSLRMLFRNSDEINEHNSYYLPSVCQNVVLETDREDIFQNIPKSDINLGCIGRLKKEYVTVAAKAFETIADRYPQIQFNAVFIGGAENKAESKKIKGILSNKKNLSLIMMGYVYPVPSSLLNKIDVFVSSSGSAGISYQYNKPTITVDGNDSFGIGVLGYTTLNSLYRKEEPKQDIACLLEKVLFTDYLKQFNYVPRKQDVASVERLQTHIDFLNKSEQTNKYYLVNRLRAAGKDKIKRNIRVVFGKKMYLWIRKNILSKFS